MTNELESRYLAERVEAMAIMHLTRRDDLIVRREVREPGDPIVDLAVEIREDGRQVSWKRFGVYLQGVRTPETIPTANSKLKISLRRFFGNYGEPSIPFSLFYFTMEDNRGYCTWLAEPTVEGGRANLRYHGERADCSILDLGSLDSIVGAVNSYYSAFKAASTIAG